MDGKDSFDEKLDFIVSHDKSRVNVIASEVHEDVFKRTDCLTCGNCCKTAPPIITKKDIKRIGKHLKMSPKQIIRNYVLEDLNGELSFDTVPCPFLGEDNHCSIYESRPNACRDYPHTGSGHFSLRRRIHVENALICPAVQEILETMEKRLKDSII